MLNVYEGILSSKQKLKNQIESVSDSSKDLLRTINRIVENLEGEALKIFNKIEILLLKDDNTKKSYKAISTIPAIGQKSALYLTLFFLKYPLANAKAMTALVGLDPVMRDSGLFRGKQRISKQGGQRLRDMLFFPTLCAIQHNDRIKVFYDRLVSNGKTRKLAVVASMRKLILMAFSLFRSREIYKPLVVEK
jgi:transposase